MSNRDRWPRAYQAGLTTDVAYATHDPMRILILGGYGVFGGRLAQLLSDDERLTLLIAGRDDTKARTFCGTLSGPATRLPIKADRAGIAQIITTHKPDLIVDASGPFQGYGADPYHVPRAAIAAGLPYLDLADGADFVTGIPVLDQTARAAGVFVLSGVSSFPVLTHAVLGEMAKDMTIRKVTGGIAPSPYAGVGMNVLRAVLGYAGSDVALHRNGKPAYGIGLGDSLIATICVPGEIPLKPLRFSLVDVPDLRAIPAAMPQIETLWMGAAPQPALLHRALTLMARARHSLALPSFATLAPLAHWMLNLRPMGEHRGGMFIQAEGQAKDHPITCSWHLLAEGEDGPLIPSMAAELIIRKCLAGQPPEPGARAALGALTLAEYETAFARRTIATGWRDQRAEALYPATLGPAFAALPAPLQTLHRPGPKAIWQGRATVTRGRSGLAAFVARIFGFPASGQHPVTVTFTTDGTGRETWSRRFGRSVMRSTQEAGTGRMRHLIVERFGPFAFGLALQVRGGRLNIIPRRWTLCGLPLPRALMPGGNAWEEERDGQFRFHVEINVPLIGKVVTYQGWLEPQQDANPPSP
jgi:hypothetical protein